MSGFLYFLEGANEAQGRELLSLRGLGHVAAPSLSTRGANTGPGGVGGIVLADSLRVAGGLIGFYPDQQTWRQVPGQEGAWVGLMNQERPGPADLARAERIAGEDVELGDGSLWHVPHAVDFGGGGLDRTIELDEEGRWRAGQIVPEYRWLWDLAWQWRDAIDGLVAWGDEHADEAGEPSFAGFADQRLELDWIASRSVEVLAANYVIGPVEAAMLGLLVTGRRWAVLNALCDMGSFRRIAEAAVGEKKTGDGPATGPGSPGGS